MGYMNKGYYYECQDEGDSSPHPETKEVVISDLETILAKLKKKQPLSELEKRECSAKLEKIETLIINFF